MQPVGRLDVDTTGMLLFTDNVSYPTEIQFLHKSLNLFLILAIVKDKLTDLWES